MSDFVHLRVHSNFSMLSGVSTPLQYVKIAKNLSHRAIAFTEYGFMSSVPDAYFACKENGIKYIPGCVLYFNDYELHRQNFEKEGGKINDLYRTNADLYKRYVENRHLTILCKNLTGFSNLVKLTTLSYKFGLFKGKPRVWLDKLLEYKDGLIVLSGGLNGPIEHELYLNISNMEFENCLYPRSEIDKTHVQYIERFKESFGDDFYFELQMPGMPEIYDDKIFRLLLAYSKKYDIKSVLTNNCHYIDQNDFMTQKIMCAVDQGTTIDSPTLRIQDTDNYYFKSYEELKSFYLSNKYSEGLSINDFDEICQNTCSIVDKIDNIDIDSSPKIPDWSVVEPNVDSARLLRQLVTESLIKKGLHNNDRKFLIDGNKVTYVEQAKLECDRFIEKGFASYFLITHDLVKYGKSKGWPFGPRGSAGGSLVCYLLGITSIDSLKWGLSFDRFMSSSRGGFMLKLNME